MYTYKYTNTADIYYIRINYKNCENYQILKNMKTSFIRTILVLP